MRKTLQYDDRTAVEVANDDEVTAIRKRIQDAEAHGYELGVQAGRSMRPTATARFLREVASLRWSFLPLILLSTAVMGVFLGAFAGSLTAGFVLARRALGL